MWRSFLHTEWNFFVCLFTAAIMLEGCKMQLLASFQVVIHLQLWCQLSICRDRTCAVDSSCIWCYGLQQHQNCRLVHWQLLKILHILSYVQQIYLDLKPPQSKDADSPGLHYCVSHNLSSTAVHLNNRQCKCHFFSLSLKHSGISLLHKNWSKEMKQRPFCIKNALGMHVAGG